LEELANNYEVNFFGETLAICLVSKMSLSEMMSRLCTKSVCVIRLDGKEMEIEVRWVFYSGMPMNKYWVLVWFTDRKFEDILEK